MTSSTFMVQTVSDTEVVITRRFAAPRHLVFAACSEARHLVHWWGRRGSTLPVCEIDARPGGHYRFVERGADGDEHPFKGEYRELAPPERAVFTQIYDVPPLDQHVMTVDITLTEEDGGKGTLLTERLIFASREDRDGAMGSGMAEGAGESLDRLAEYLARWHPPGAGPLGQTRSTVTLEGEREMVMARTFAAPRALVFRAWTDPEQIVRWFGPRGWQTTVYEMDVRPGGRWHYCMRSEEGQESWGLTRYRQVVAPELLAHTDAFSDKDANIHPPEMDITLTFTEQDGGRTTLLTSRTSFPTAEMRSQIIDMGAIPGMEETLDRLDELLAGAGA